MKIRYIRHIFICLCYLALFTNTTCDEDDETATSCGPAAVIDPGFFESAVSSDFSTLSAEIMDNCLTVEISASGCSGESWSLVLVDSGAVAESSPEQRLLKLVFGNEELCLAVIGQTRMFDLTNLQVENSNSIILNIEGIEEGLTYDY
ncbi:MAG: hypothetical protein AAF688_07350 [Bacteroidota bacterium]